jgi:hypothetical protein
MIIKGLGKENFGMPAPFIDVIKIHGFDPLLVSELVLEKKINYHDFITLF